MSTSRDPPWPGYDIIPSDPPSPIPREAVERHTVSVGDDIPVLGVGAIDTNSVTTSPVHQRTVSEKIITVNIYPHWMEVRVEDAAGAVIERFETVLEVKAYLKGIEAGVHPRTIVYPIGWAP